MPITEKAIRASIKSGKSLSDGHGLSLLIRNGSAYWQHSYQLNGKQTHLRLGAYPALSIIAARKLHAEQREMLRSGIDPAAEKRKAKQEAKREFLTFQDAAEAWLSNHRKGLSPKYAAVIERRIEKWLTPKLGKWRLDQIESPAVLATIKAVEETGSIDLSRRMKIITSQICEFSIAHGWIKHDPTYGINKALAPKPEVKHRARLKAEEVPDFFKRLEESDSYPITKLAIRFIAHTAVRTDELRLAEWSEIDGDLWRIPSEHTKMGRPHLVPLSDQAVEILEEARKLGKPLLFPSEESRSGVMSENCMLYTLYRIGFKGRATVHGFRGLFSTTLNEQGFNRDWIELQLGHVEANRVRSAYNAAEWLPQRREMMQRWSDWLDGVEYVSREEASKRAAGRNTAFWEDD